MHLLRCSTSALVHHTNGPRGSPKPVYKYASVYPLLLSLSFSCAYEFKAGFHASLIQGGYETNFEFTSYVRRIMRSLKESTDRTLMPRASQRYYAIMLLIGMRLQSPCSLRDGAGRRISGLQSVTAPHVLPNGASLDFKAGLQSPWEYKAIGSKDVS